MTVCVQGQSSLIIGGFDLMDWDNSPVMLNVGYDRGAPAPTVSQVQTTILDGAPILGTASGNRHPSIPVTVVAADRVALAELVNQLLVAVDQQTWTIQWTPAGGYPVVYDCFRATVAIVSTLDQEERTVSQSLVINCEALPYARSPYRASIPLIGSPLLIDALDAGPAPTVVAVAGAGTVGTPTYVTTPPPAQGSHSLSVPITPQRVLAGDVYLWEMAFTAERTGLSIPILAGVNAVKLQMRQDGGWSHFAWSYTDLAITCDDGNTYDAQGQPPAGGQILLGFKGWTTVLYNYGGVTGLGAGIPAGVNITGWKLTMHTTRASWSQLYRPTIAGPTHLYFDSMIGYPPAVQGVSDGQGVTLHLNGVLGTARTPVSLALSQVAAGAFTTWCVYSSPLGNTAEQPLIPLTAGTYTTDPSVRYDGTYDVWVGLTPSGAGTRTLNVVASESLGGVSTPGLGAAVTVGTGPALVYLGSIALPINDYPDEASTTTTFTVTSSNGADTLLDLLMLDTRGQTIVVAVGAPSRTHVWADEVNPGDVVALGGLWAGNAADRSNAISVIGALIRADELLIQPGDSTLMVYSPQGALQGTASYYPRWLQEATA